MSADGKLVTNLPPSITKDKIRSRVQWQPKHTSNRVGTPQPRNRSGSKFQLTGKSHSGISPCSTSSLCRWDASVHNNAYTVYLIVLFSTLRMSRLTCMERRFDVNNGKWDKMKKKQNQRIIITISTFPLDDLASIHYCARQVLDFSLPSASVIGSFSD